LSPATGGIIREVGWDVLVDRIMTLKGMKKPKPSTKGERSQDEAEYEGQRQRLSSGGTLYDSMRKLVSAGYVQAVGESGKKERAFRITHDGRIALAAVESLGSEEMADTEVRRTAAVLLKHKNFVRPLPAQEKFLNDVGQVDSNLLIQMPPGSGKTFLAMIATLMRLQKGKKCLYLAPYTSLSRQIIDEYAEMLRRLGYSVVRLDAQSNGKEQNASEADLVVGIYESVLGSILEGNKWTDRIGLVVVDEITELDSQVDVVTAENLGSDRSGRLDCLITLLKPGSQIIALSSRFGETEQVADWLDAMVFRPSVRLAPDEFIVTKSDGGVEIVSSDGTQRYCSEMGNMIDAVLQHIGDYREKSILFVVGSRGGAESLARRLAVSHPRPMTEETLRQVIGTGEEMPAATRLRQVLEHGVAFHHAGLDAELRGRLERGIRDCAVRCVVATTGITSGMSFPFDCVVVLLTPDSGMGIALTRARYLQFAGRIGEYHLAQNGGAVYIVYEPRIRQFANVHDLRIALLESPVEPLRPKIMDPALMASLVMRESIRRNRFTRDELESAFVGFARETFGSSVQGEYVDSARAGFSKLFEWLVAQQHIEPIAKKYRMSAHTKAAIESGLDLFDFSAARTRFDKMTADESTAELIDVILGFRLVQSSRPRTVLPSQIELQVAGLPPVEKWYSDLAAKRKEVKRHVLSEWTDEKDIRTIAESEAELIRRIDSTDRRSYSGEIDEGDLASLVQWSSEISASIARFLQRAGNKPLAVRFSSFARQLSYGVRADLSQSDLFELCVQEENTFVRQMSRPEVRVLFDHGYRTVRDVVRRDIDASKPGLARDRFARNCGLDMKTGKMVYRAALEYVRSGATK